MEKAWQGGGNGVEVMNSLLGDIKPYLASRGRLQMVYSTVSNIEKIWSNLIEQDFTVEVTAKKKIFFEELNLITAMI